MSSTFSDIIKIEGDADTNNIILTATFNKTKKILHIEFSNNFEKYLFKSIFYNRMVILKYKRIKQKNKKKTKPYKNIINKLI